MHTNIYPILDTCIVNERNLFGLALVTDWCKTQKKLSSS